MSKIRILPEQLANQIAAGEVVERPASVVKELVENSLDAGAGRIEVEVEGSTRLIRIIDDGEGMDEDDVLLSLERHGTSKIRSDDDLAAIATLGFRGEAIPSISSVSRMIITSRRHDAELGTRAEMHFGKLVRVHEAGCPAGTMFEVKDLFGNTPARRKFLRTARTELGHIDEVMKNYALARPDVTFSLTVGGKQSLYLDANRSLGDRLARLLHFQGEFLKVGDEQATQPERRLYGYLIPPERLPNGPARLRLFVNGRAVKDRLMMHGAAEGLRGFLMKGKNPAGLLHLVLPAAEVDVNVHPAKHEVRFRHSREVHLLISQTVAGAMHAEQRRLQASIFGGGHAQTAPIPLERDQQAEDPFAPPTASERPVPTPHPNERAVLPKASRPANPPTNSAPLNPTPPHPTVKTSSGLNAEHARQPLATAEPPTPAAFPKAATKPSEAAPHPGSLLPDPPTEHGLQIIGQYDDLYIFCRSAEGLLVIDQHAAHERLLYEELRQQFRQKGLASQNLLFPETVELSVFQAQLVEKHGEELEHMGFSLREFGGTSFVISAVPALVGRGNPKELLFDVLEQFGSENSRRESGDKIDMVLATMACRAAVKAGTALSTREIEALLTKMARADLFSHCPHGRPVAKRFTASEIKKWFYRT